MRCIISQEFIKNSKLVRYYDLYKILKNEQEFLALPIQTSQKILMVIDIN